MELNEETVQKAFDCCIKAETFGDCEKLGCPAHTTQGCYYYLRTDEDYEGIIHIEMCKDALSIINELTEENERLREQNERYAELEEGCYVTGYKNIKADTVREMQERLKEGFRKYDRANWSVRAIIDEIAKEMLEGSNG